MNLNQYAYEVENKNRKSKTENATNIFRFQRISVRIIAIQLQT